MKILVINPNTTCAMTELVVQQLSLYLPRATVVESMTATAGSSVIASRESFDAAASTSLSMVMQAIKNKIYFDAVLLGCFGDPGLETMRKKVAHPIIGLAWASMHKAEMMKRPYAVVTAGMPWRDILTQQFKAWGASDLFLGVEILSLTGLQILNDPINSLPAVLKAITDARSLGAHNIILGGAVFAGYKNLMDQQGHATQGLIDCAQASASALCDLN